MRNTNFKKGGFLKWNVQFPGTFQSAHVLMSHVQEREDVASVYITTGKMVNFLLAIFQKRQREPMTVR